MKRLIPFVLAAYLALTGCEKKSTNPIVYGINKKEITEVVYRTTVYIGLARHSNAPPDSKYHAIVRVTYQGDQKINCSLNLESIDNKTGIACFDKGADGSWETKYKTHTLHDSRLEEFLSSDLSLTAMTHRIMKE